MTQTKILNPNVNFLNSKSEICTLQEMRDSHTIPVFAKDNLPTISEAEFFETTKNTANDIFSENPVNEIIKVSHPIKGRTFDARFKKASELKESEKTIYFERCAFVIEYPICDTVAGQKITLTVAGVKAYNLDNLNTKGEHRAQRFKIGVGFKVNVCTNLCIWGAGANLNIEAGSLPALNTEIETLFSGYSQKAQIEAMREFGEHELSEKQFATLIGKTRLYQHLPPSTRQDLPNLIITDNQINTAAKQYYNDPNFSASLDGSIDLWRFYNCLTEGVKSSYIDTFLDRNVNAMEFTSGILQALNGDERFGWFLN